MTHLVVGAVVVDSLVRPTQVLAARRSRPAELAESWEFPGGKVEDGETPQQALVREVREELDVEIEVGAEVGDGFPIGDDLLLRLFLAEITRGDLAPGESHDELRWLHPSELDDVTWLPADQAALAAVRRLL